jgi:glucuronoarabinoxylan endo-1,4-beta-xylanase
MTKSFLLSLLLLLGCPVVKAQSQRATMRLDATVKHQQITGFGGFVCSPQFTYNHMSTSDIKKVWGPNSTVGCNIMRLYIPIGRNYWSQSLATAKQAKQMGLIVFASPWGQPAEWKTNGTSNAKNSDGTLGYLKKEYWDDYAQYLEDYVQYLRTNGVELDAISIQNEPDWPAEYAGCMWSASDIAEFVKTYGRSISCKIMAPETLAVSDSYVNALNKTDVLPCFDIYGGHQYGGIQSAYKNLASKGKQIWMTEYLINWNEAENNTRNFDFSKDFFNFFSSINQCMLGDFNAWIHYAAKRYYAMLGDGQRGTSSGVVTKRGYIMAHFARFVTGMTRIDATFSGSSLEGSAYLSTSGDTVVAVVANTSNEAVSLTLDLPFYTMKGQLTTTSKAKNFTSTTLNQETETCRPAAELAAQSVCTVLFVRSRDRQASNMAGTTTRFDRLDDQKITRSTFGTGYKLSNKTKTFDHSTPLISSRTSAAYGYVQFDERFSQLIMQVKKVTSTMNYNSAKTTLLYVNAKGQLSSHNYGEIDFNRRENFTLVFDLSPATLPDGCQGLISMTNNNWSSKLTITFADVYLANGGQYAAKLSGAYVDDDSYVLDYTSDPSCTSIDLTAVTDLPEQLPWMQGNRVSFLTESSVVAGNNVVQGNECASLQLTPDGGDFRPARSFSANTATFACGIEGMRLLMLPFSAPVPEGITAYSLSTDLIPTALDTIPAHQPVLVAGQGDIVFLGTGEVSHAFSPLDQQLRGTYAQLPLYVGDYVLRRQGDQWGLLRLAEPAVLHPFEAYATLDASADFLPLDFSQTGIADQPARCAAPLSVVYSLSGQSVSRHHRGLLLQRSADGKVRKMVRRH